MTEQKLTKLCYTLDNEPLLTKMEISGKQRDNLREKKKVSKPKWITSRIPQESEIQPLAEFHIYKVYHICTTKH